MRSGLPAVLLVLACAAPGAARRARIAIAEDGRTVIAGGETWRAPEGVAFFQRDGALHVVSLVPGNVFDVRVPLDERGRPAPPDDAPFDLAGGALRFRGGAALAIGAAGRVDLGQLYRHDDHFHLTHRFENADWQALYRARADDSGLPPVARQLAAVVLATLVDARIPGAPEAATAQALERMASVIAKARRGIDGQLPAKQVMAMVLHDFEIADDGRTLSIEGRTYRGEGGIRFAYCGDHFHVEAPKTGWTQAVSLRDAEPGRFELPRSTFFAAAGDAVAERTGAAPWRDLLAKGHIHVVGDSWYVSETYASPALARLERAAADGALPRAVRERARASVMEILRLRLDVEGDAEFQARLASIDQTLERRWREVERETAAARPRH